MDLKYLLRGDFFDDINKKRVRVIIFIIALCMFSIFLSSILDQKIHEINRLNKEIKQLKSNYIDINMKLIKIYNSPRFKNKLKELGLKKIDKRYYEVWVENYKRDAN